ncbi:hypothetical protein JHK85_004290 [Glycine max]|nr:hypothetical protein JHK87_003985 [Glycine soja]KAG5063107.1 hypothetical protein JHK85_004290 [Glycine max]
MSHLPSNLLPVDGSPEWMNRGDNTWQLTSATLVGLQSVPGLVILYGSIVKKKWALNSAFMALYAFAAVLVCWVGWCYKMSFGERILPFLGQPNTALDREFVFRKTFAGEFPNATMVYFQLVFAAITLILIAGALLGRMNFYAWMLFVPLWVTFSYTICAFSIWSTDGWLFKMGLIDYSGGFVIHLSSGVAGFVAACWVGPRAVKDRERFPPNNILLMLAGAGLLWMGWSGFNGGDPYAASIDASLAVLNTHVCTAMSLLTWLFLDILFFGKPSVIGATQGMITGLVCITPAAEDSLHYTGLVYGIFNGRPNAGFRQMMVQLLGIVFVILLNVTTTSIVCLLVRIIVPLRLSEDDLQVGDEAVHGEVAYALWGDGEKLETATEPLTSEKNLEWPTVELRT